MALDRVKSRSVMRAPTAVQALKKIYLLLKRFRAQKGATLSKTNQKTVCCWVMPTSAPLHWVGPGANEYEQATPTLSLCHGIFTD